jgi:hypothetical protein
VFPPEPVRLRPPAIELEEAVRDKVAFTGGERGGETGVGISVGRKNSTVLLGVCWYDRCRNSRRKRIELLK